MSSDAQCRLPAVAAAARKLALLDAKTVNVRMPGGVAPVRFDDFASSPRRRPGSRSCSRYESMCYWIPAFAGMTRLLVRRQISGFGRAGQVASDLARITIWGWAA